MDLNNYTEFGKVSDIWKDGLHDLKGLNEFIKNVINVNNNNSRMLPDISNIYVLVSKPNFPFNDLNMEQKQSINFPYNEYGIALRKQLYSIDLDIGHTNYVLGYVWMYPFACQCNRLIKYIDSRISGLNIAEYMINKHNEYILPAYVDNMSIGYWIKYFNKGQGQQQQHTEQIMKKWNNTLQETQQYTTYTLFINWDDVMI